MKQKSTRITFINIVSLFGLALLACSTFMGAMLCTRGSIGLSVGIAGGSALVIYLLMSGAIYAKGVETDFKRWHKVEILLAILFWVVSVVPAIFTSHFVSVISNGDELRRYVAADATGLRDVFNDYETFERNALSITRTGLESSIGQPVDIALREYMTDASINNDGDIDSWMLTQRGLLLGSSGVDGFSYIDYKANVDSVISKWETEMSSLNPMTVSRHSGELADVATSVTECLANVSQQARLPHIEFNNGGYRIDRANMTFSPSDVMMQFDGKVSTLSGSVFGYIIALVLLLLVFTDYIMAHRSGKNELTDHLIDNNGVRL